MAEHICTPIGKQFDGVYFVGHVGFDPNHPDVARILREMGWVRSDERIRELEGFCKAVIRYAGNAGDDYLSNKAREALEPPR